MSPGGTVGEVDKITQRYNLKEQVGGGRMSSVYLAEDSASGNAQVAVKVLNTSHGDDIKRELFKRETSALRKLRHPNIVRMLDSSWPEDGSPPYLVLEYQPYSLDRYLKGELRSQLSGFQPYRVMRELGEALAHAHSENVVHRDIKPSNILLDPAGRPMLTDFGISKLLTQLTVGETLAGFWSSGYASPEQRAALATGPESDIFSLGAVFFQLLSGKEPPPEGPSPLLVDEVVNNPVPIRNLLKKMLAAESQERFFRGSDLLSALDITRRHETLPSHFLVLTRTAIRDIVAAGLSFTEDFRSVADVIIEDLGGMELEEVHIHRDRRDNSDIIILGDALRLICAVDEAGDALVVKAVQTPYLPNLESEKSRCLVYRAMWDPMNSGFRSGEDAGSLSVAKEELTNMLSELATYENVGKVSDERRESRRDFIEDWNVALGRNRNRIEREATALRYSDVSEESDRWRFTLADFPPDNLEWEDDAPLAIRQSADAPRIPIGNLMNIHGRSIEVAKQSNRFRRSDHPIPERGLLTSNLTEALVANSRQSNAVSAFLNEQMINPSLARVIVDPATATRFSGAPLQYFQDWLSDDQKEAVSKAVSSNELFLIQGPPGTGKTSVIAEIALQIMKREPEARILLTSQSNVAVDHALTQIASASGTTLPEMIRLGRSEKIGHGGESWTLAERAQTWRQEVLDRCEPELAKLRSSERQARDAIKAIHPDNVPDEETAGTLEEWITEAKEIAEQLQEYEQEYSSTEVEATTFAKEAIAEMVEQTRQELREQINSLNELLPQPVSSQGMNEQEMLAEVITAASTANRRSVATDDPANSELHRIQDLRRVLTDWTRVVGLTQDFQELIGKSARVVAATCLFSGKRKSGAQLGETSFDWAIIDEAGRATVPEVLIPIVQSERAILVGDERQLPPMVEDMMGDYSGGFLGDHSLDTSLFQTLVEQVEESGWEFLSTLSTQNRMHPAIGNLISTVFYEGRLENGRHTRSRQSPFEWMPAPVTWISTSMTPNRMESRVGASFSNSAEAEVILDLLIKLEEKSRERRRRPSVAVISGYSAQVELLGTRIDVEDNERWRSIEIEIATVDSFQGRECDVVIYSTVRSNNDQRIGFLKDRRRINVALSRSRHLLVIVGDTYMMETATIGSDLNPFAAVLTHIGSNPQECRIIQPAMVSSL